MAISQDKALMHTIIEADQKLIETAKFIKDSINQNISSFTPSKFFEQLVTDYKTAKNLYGETILRKLTGFECAYIEKNIKIPEFQRQIKENIEKNIEKLKDEGILGEDNFISEKGYELASVIMYREELDSITPKGLFGEHFSKEVQYYGDKYDVRNFSKNLDRYKDINIKTSAKKAIRRGHKRILVDDLYAHERKKKGQVCVIYALDASGSMKGKKIELCKKAGIALAFKAVENNDLVGLVVFGHDVKSFVEPTTDFSRLLSEMTRFRAARDTDIVKSIEKAIEIFPERNMTKHLIIISDALPTKGDDPEKLTLEAASMARSLGITISFVGINLDEKGRKLGQKIAEIGEGRFYIAKDLENIDKLILEDYYAIA